jgi:hypothetical protein
MSDNHHYGKRAKVLIKSPAAASENTAGRGFSLAHAIGLALANTSAAAPLLGARERKI